MPFSAAYLGPISGRRKSTDALTKPGLLAGRPAGVTGWLGARARMARAAIGYFGAST